ncbi:hypothetical protein N7478_004776 [Penicillium angulare]|uniref:uncharacterized protein n=1 Tax=Penicillium angulare TaxID=116970 RepID=UPI0025422DD8|nr:uncharacterized protein N7478_004776 [Penicillium angulare]KAJ5279404.1 hypothetical protein N7478_004776 [Penicillium angulare]
MAAFINRHIESIEANPQVPRIYFISVGPVDTTAKVITETVRGRRTTKDEEPCAIFHIYFDAEPVDFKTWLDTLAGFTNPIYKDLRDKPALKLLSFFQGTAATEVGPWIGTVKTQAPSKTLRELKAIDAPLMENWMNQWKF